MRKFLINLISLSVVFSVAAIAQEGAQNDSMPREKKAATLPKGPVKLDPHEVRGVDRGELSLSMDDQLNDESLLDAMDDSRANWNRRVLQSVEDFTQW